MERDIIVAGTGIKSRRYVIRRYCRKEMPVTLVREPDNEHDTNAVAVYIKVPRLLGLLGKSRRLIGYLKTEAARGVAHKMDAGETVTASVTTFSAPPGRHPPRVSLRLEF